MQIGLKGHAEYGWSSNLREQILQYNYQLVRTNNENILSLQRKLREILNQLQYNVEFGKISDGEYTEYMIVLYKMIGYTRDVVEGKGEYTLSYMMIAIWNEIFPNLAKFAIKQCFYDFGSWKDMKYFCNYYIQQQQQHSISSHSSFFASRNSYRTIDIDTTSRLTDPSFEDIISFVLSLTNKQLKIDEHAPINSLSLVAKWIPREKSKRFGWIFNELAKHYYPICSPIKAKMQYRKLISRLNTALDTTQIKMCNGKWEDINHAKTTSITTMKQIKALLNINKSQMFLLSPSRIQCAEHLIQEIENKSQLKGKRISMFDFVKQAIKIIGHGSARHTTPNTRYFKLDFKDILTKILNSQWKDNSEQSKEMSTMIPIVDISLPREKLYEAIGLGIRIAEKSILGKRLMTFSSTATWHNLEDCNNFVDMVEIITKEGENNMGLSTNVYSALDTILSVIIETKMTINDVAGLSLIILSDMQNVPHTSGHLSIVYDKIREKYANAGVLVHGMPYNMPHIIFWNMQSTNGFPVSAMQENVSMMSGSNPAQLNVYDSQYCLHGDKWIPWTKLVKSLNKERYKCMENKIKEQFCCA